VSTPARTASAPPRLSRAPRASDATALAPATYTLCRDRDAEARVSQDLARLAAAVDAELDRALSALFLVGSYARGEGSVVERSGELHADSCYELIAVVGSAKRNDHALFERIAATWSDRLGVDVHITARTLSELEHASAALTWVDVAAGKIELLIGDSAVLTRLRALHPKDVPAQAWAATLCDAAVSVAIWNIDPLGRQHRGARALHQATLACGDALLLSASCFAFDTDERCAELVRIEGHHDLPGLGAAYGRALEHQARPDRASDAGASAAEHIATIARAHLHLEAKRLGTPRDALGYALFNERLWSDTPFFGMRALRATLRAARSGASAPLRPGDARERLARAAVLLAYEPERPEARHLAARLLDLRHDARTTPGDVELFVRLRELRDQVQRTRLDDPLANARYGRG
jgi:hypothetical protein